MRRSTGVWLIMFVSAALATGSSLAAYREMMPFIASGGTIETKFEALSGGAIRPGLSFYSKKILLDDCNYSLNSFSILMLDEKLQDKIRQNCSAMASMIVDEAPTFSYAWYVRALASSSADEPGTFEDALLWSQRTAPNQEDLAYYRAVLAYYNWSALAPAARETLAADIVVSAHSNRGLAWLAGRYAEDESFREVIIKALEQAPADIQRRFLQTIAITSRPGPKT